MRILAERGELSAAERRELTRRAEDARPVIGTDAEQTYTDGDSIEQRDVATYEAMRDRARR